MYAHTVTYEDGSIEEFTNNTLGGALTFIAEIVSEAELGGSVNAFFANWAHVTVISKITKRNLVVIETMIVND